LPYVCIPLYVLAKVLNSSQWKQQGSVILSKTVGTITEEGEKAEVAEDLELLADFVADVGVVGMKFGQSVGVSVNFRESEVEFA
jgi:hypothetical protein